MPVQPTYPGVYVQEVPSGVRTITGVATSIALFIGRTKMGPVFEPVLCLSYSDFERNFSSDTSFGDMARAVRLFFLNGGTQCYVVRIVNQTTATSSRIDLKNETGTPVLRAEAKSMGAIGDTIRMNVTYNGLQPEMLFNLEVFRWVKNSAGVSVKTDTEFFQGLSMNPAHARYAATYVTQESKLIKLTDIAPAIAAGTPGYSRTGPVPNNLLNSATTAKQFNLSVNGAAPVTIDLGAAAIGSLTANVTAIQSAINTAISPLAATVVANPMGSASPFQIQIPDAEVQITPSSSNDIAIQLMLGATQGGIEVSPYSVNRPAANGLVFNRDHFDDFATLQQDAFAALQLVPPPSSATPIALGTTLETTGSGDPMSSDNFTGSVTGHSDGVREKFAILADAINNQRNTDPTYPWKAEVWGSRLAILPVSGSDNLEGNIITSGGGGTNIGPAGSDFFIMNTRYYSLGISGTGNFQINGAPGLDGSPPALEDYHTAYVKVDKEVDIFNLLLLPRDAQVSSTTAATFLGEASAFCLQRRAFLLIDAPPEWDTVEKATKPVDGVNKLRQGIVKDHSAVFYPRVTMLEGGLKQQVGPTGAIAGLMARIDASRGVWKAAAGTEADLRGINGLEYRFSDAENGVLNPHAINTIRIFPNGIVNWGARTLDGDDDFASEYKYIPVRRTALFIEESLYRGLKWVVFEPNDEPLWAQIRLNVGAFMHSLFRQGAFQGKTKQEAYFVKCDSETTTQNDINLGIVNIWVGFAPLKPAEFVVLYLQQMTGQIQV